MTDRSEREFDRACAVIPGGVNSPVRAMRAIGRNPIFIKSGSGAEIEDVDGNTYVDYVCSWGPLIAGHAHSEVVEAVTAAAAGGTSFGAPTEAETDLAEEIVERVPAAEMVRMVNSGTEAAMSALRLARGATGRDKVLKFAGAYHGHVDALLAQAGSGLATAAVPASPGVTEAQAADTVIVPWNSEERVEEAVAEHGAELAAIIAEPIPANMGVVPPNKGFLELLRELSTSCGALLVFDEVITGFRVARGGAQELYDINPDLVVLGKVIGGGVPAAAYAGRSDLMCRLAPEGDVYQAGTLSGNPLAVAAGLATLKLLDEGAYEQLGRYTDRLAQGLSAAALSAGVPVYVASSTGLLTVFFSSQPVHDYEGASSCRPEDFAEFCRALLDRGIYSPPSQFEAWFPSLAHGEKELERTLEAAEHAFGVVA